ncbi:translocation protein SEC62 [Anoplophora glabripennis]|uniref:translocation protein SEC62 n=1 Tax=Anoplophora glabripennis TaxID=217634 RepID=UPI000C77BC5C|nr:translocation protein SEC62 [Anoplophora glabripennis]
MAEKKKGKKRKEEYVPPGEKVIDKPSKEEFTLAKWMRKNVPIKKTKFLNHNVEYFTGKRAVDALMESDFVKRDEPLFKTRDEIVDYLHVMLEHKFYHRARKVPVSESELKSKKKEKKAVEPVEEEKKDKDKGTDAESSVVEGAKDAQPDKEKEKRKKKIRLDMHNDQRFVDSLDAYVWIYDPIPFHYWIIGTLLVLGAIGVCLFPLWPPSIRLGVYYLSVAAAGFLVSIIVLAVIRLIVFCLIWTVTMGKHHLWILPNLTEDVGFFASFWPLYTYQYKGKSSGGDKKGKKKKKDKDSDAEDENDDKPGDAPPEKVETVQPDPAGYEGNHEDAADDPAATEQPGGSESESESSQRSSTGKDFEMVDQTELE